MLIDARNQTCPKPVVMTLEALPKLAAGETLEVLVNDQVAVGNLTRLAEEKNCVLTIDDRGEHMALTLAPKQAVAPSDSRAEAAELCALPQTSGAVVAFDGQTMGRGNEELGKILVKGLIYALAHGDEVPTKALFYNGGAYLTCTGSESLDDIRELEGRGCEVLTCGTCLDFYGMRDQLAVGGVTNLYAIAQIIAGERGVTTI